MHLVVAYLNIEKNNVFFLFFLCKVKHTNIETLNKEKL